MADTPSTLDIHGFTEKLKLKLWLQRTFTNPYRMGPIFWKSSVDAWLGT